MNHELNFIVLILIIIWLLIPTRRKEMSFFGDVGNAFVGAAKATSCFIGAGWGCAGAPPPPTCQAPYFKACKDSTGKFTSINKFADNPTVPICGTNTEMVCHKVSCPDDYKLSCIIGGKTDPSPSDIYSPIMVGVEPTCRGPKDVLNCSKEVTIPLNLKISDISVGQATRIVWCNDGKSHPLLPTGDEDSCKAFGGLRAKDISAWCRYTCYNQGEVDATIEKDWKMADCKAVPNSFNGQGLPVNDKLCQQMCPGSCIKSAYYSYQNSLMKIKDYSDEKKLTGDALEQFWNVFRSQPDYKKNVARGATVARQGGTTPKPGSKPSGTPKPGSKPSGTPKPGSKPSGGGGGGSKPSGGGGGGSKPSGGGGGPKPASPESKGVSSKSIDCENKPKICLKLVNASGLKKDDTPSDCIGKNSIKCTNLLNELLKT